MCPANFLEDERHRLRAKSPQPKPSCSANSSWPPDIQRVQSRLEENIQLSMAIVGSTLDGSPWFWYPHPCASPFLWVWAGPSHLFLMNRIQQCDEMPLPRLGYRRLWFLSGSFFCFLSHNPCFGRRKLLKLLWVALWRSPHGEEVMFPARTWRLPTLTWGALDVDQPPRWALKWWLPRPRQWLHPGETQGQRTQLNCTRFLTQRNCEKINVYCFKMPSLGIICYTEVNN